MFKQMVYKMLPLKDAEKMERHVLRVYDENNDGVVDFTEFMVMYYIMSDGTPEEVLVKIFRIFDLNSDGVISIMEMTKLITDMYGMLKKEVKKEVVELNDIVFSIYYSLKTSIINAQNKYLMSLNCQR